MAYEPRPPRNLTCARCGNAFTHQGLGHPKWCEPCRPLGMKEAARENNRRLDARKTRGPFTCEWCSKVYFAARKQGQGERFCSRECGFAWQAHDALPPSCAVSFNTCRVCASVFTTNNPRVMCDPCRDAQVVTHSTCKRCGHTWKRDRYQHAHGLCNVCSVIAREERREADRDARRAMRRSQRYRCPSKYSERAKHYGCAYEPINVMRVFARDGWRCRMCGVLTPRSLRGTYDACAPELDHIVPLSRGGPHAWHNVQCLCRECNHVKGDAMPHELDCEWMFRDANEFRLRADAR
jgi:5-methylcytosine-specific restriction endonuclease McrA